jgi:hypothetical protein
MKRKVECNVVRATGKGKKQASEQPPTILLREEPRRGRLVAVIKSMHTSLRTVWIVGSLAGLTALMSGCSTTDGKSATNPNHVGPAIGQGVGTGIGVVGGNVVGGVVGVGEGVVSGAKKPFTNEPRVVRTWRTETTSDGRTIQVPYDILVDQYGRPIEKK